jgi:quaternary ammonium compound-resistance protein SugE
MSPWAWLITAGLVEVVWAQTIRPTQSFTRPLPTLLCFALGATSVYLLTRALDAIPTGTGYVVFSGIGACGGVLIGLLVHREPASSLRLLGLLVIVAGVLLTHAAEAGATGPAAPGPVEPAASGDDPAPTGSTTTAGPDRRSPGTP